MASQNFPGKLPGIPSTGYLTIGSLQKATARYAGYPGKLPGIPSTGSNNIGAIQRGPDATGTLSVTEDGDTLSATGTLLITGTLSVTEAGDTLSATGTVAITGTLSVTEDGDTLSATGVLTGAAASTLTAGGGDPPEHVETFRYVQPRMAMRKAVSISRSQAYATLTAYGAVLAIGRGTTTGSATGTPVMLAAGRSLRHSVAMARGQMRTAMQTRNYTRRVTPGFAIG